MREWDFLNTARTGALIENLMVVDLTARKANISADHTSKEIRSIKLIKF